MVKALVLWADDRSTNLGVRALAEGAAALAERAWPEISVDHLSYGTTIAPMRVGDPKALLREMVTGRAGLKRWLAGYDVVLDTRGGDSFADIYGLDRLRAICLLAELVRMAKVPLVLAPQTIGPFTSRQGRLMGRRSLRTSTLVMVRDTASLEPARRLGREETIRHTTDVVFALSEPPPGPRREVLLNVSGLLWQPNPHVDHQAYRSVVGALYRRLRAEGRQVALLAHVLDGPEADNDVPACRALAATLDDAPEVVVPESLADVRSSVAGAEVVIGSRMHACLNALSTGTPAVALAYSRKFAPLLDDLGWSATVDLRTSGDPVADTVGQLARLSGGDAVSELRKRARARVEEAVTSLRDVVTS